MLPDFAEIARRLIVFAPRVNEGRVWLNPKESGYRGDDVVQSFLNYLRNEFRAARMDDLETILYNFLIENPALPNWYLATLEGLNIDIRFEGGEPKIRPLSTSGRSGIAESWMDLSAIIDPDILVTLQFTRIFLREMHHADLENWGVYCRINEPLILGQPMWRRLRDIHTHLSGCEPAPLVWQELLSRQITIDTLPAYSPRNDDVFGTWPERLDERTLIEEVMSEWRPIYSQHLPDTAEHTAFNHQPRALWSERCTLQRAWLYHLRNPDDELFARSFDRYMFAKNRFVRRHIQSPENNPGLESFRRNFDSLKIVRQNKSPRVERILLSRWRDFVFDSQALDHVELRIAAMRDVVSYRRFLTSLHSVFRMTSRRPPRPGIPGRYMPRFVVHFIRPRIEARSEAPYLDIDRLRRDLDRQFMSLRHFLYDNPRSLAPGEALDTDRSRPEFDASELTLDQMRQLVVGVDVANVERDTPIEYYVPYLNFLRGQNLDEQANELLNIGSEYLTSTAAYYRQSYQSARQGHLGLTLHVGEDYFHPLIGLREVWNAVNLCNMLPTDRLGHALALGTDFTVDALQQDERYVAPVGRLLDAVVWADRRLGTVDGVDRRVSRILEDIIERSSREIYQRTVRKSVLYEAIRLRKFPVSEKQLEEAPFLRLTGLRADAEEIDILRADAYDPDVCRRRALMRTVPHELSNPLVTEAFNLIRSELIRQICERRIVIEVNPSSNRCVGGFTRMKDHPILKTKVRERGIRVAVSADDPGNFGTRLDNEYALVVEGLREMALPESEVAAIVTEIIVTSHDAAFGRAAYSNNPAEWTSDQADEEFGESVRHDPRSGPD